MKLYIANGTCSQAVQIIANELGLALELVHFDVSGKTTSNGENFAEINPLLYVPVLALDNAKRDFLSETIVIASYLAGLRPDCGLIPVPGTLDRARFDQLLVFIATEIAQKHIPLMRKLLTEEGKHWAGNRLVNTYKLIDDRLADGRPFLTGNRLTVADAYLWGTLWHERSDVDIVPLTHLMAWKGRMEVLPSVQKALVDEAEIVGRHRALLTVQTA